MAGFGVSLLGPCAALPAEKEKRAAIIKGANERGAAKGAQRDKDLSDMCEGKGEMSCDGIKALPWDEKVGPGSSDKMSAELFSLGATDGRVLLV